MTTTVSGSSITFNDNTTQNTSAYGGGFAMRNRIINGDCRIDQRNAGASVTPTDGQYTLDRWRSGLNQTGKYSVQQNAGSVTPPAGFTNYLGVTSLSSYSVGATDLFWVGQLVEGYNFADMGWGTANAKTVTLSFWVRSSLTGTFGGIITNSAANRTYPYSYTISQANTWEQKTITIAGDTTGTWLTTNGIALWLEFSIGTGSTYQGTAGSWGSTFYGSVTGQTSVVGTNGATFYITGVQLEKGSTATSFDYRPYGQELELCQRYFNRFGGSSSDFAFGIGFKDAASTISLSAQMPVSLRATPSVSFGGTVYTIGGAQFLTLSSPTAIIISNNNLLIRIKATTSASITNGNTTFSFYTGGASDYVDYSSEL